MTNNAKTNEMREALIERAKATLKAKFIESPADVSHNELPSLLASFAAYVLAEREAEIELARRLQLSVRMFLACFGSNAEWEREKRNAKPITRKDVKAMREALEAFAALKTGEQ